MADDAADPKRMNEIIDENRRLKARLSELDVKPHPDTRSAPAFPKDQTQVTKVLKLLEQRDHTLDEIAVELQQKKQELEEAIGRLEERNEQLQTWIATLGLYQQILENEPYSILGFNRHAKLILYNKTATSTFGERLKQWRLKEVEDLDFSQFDPYTPMLLRETLKTGANASRSISRGGRKITTSAFVMGSPPEPHGAMLKIAITDEKK